LIDCLFCSVVAGLDPAIYPLSVVRRWPGQARPRRKRSVSPGRDAAELAHHRPSPAGNAALQNIACRRM